MKNIVVRLDDEADVQLILELLKKMRIRSKVLTTEDMEDVGLGDMMLKVDRSEKVSRGKIMRKLSGE